jgi:hypothetical protein
MGSDEVASSGSNQKFLELVPVNHGTRDREEIHEGKRG